MTKCNLAYFTATITGSKYSIMLGNNTILLSCGLCYNLLTGKKTVKNARAKKRAKKLTGNYFNPVGKEKKTMAKIGDNYDKLFLTLSQKISKEEVKTVKTILRLLVVHANPSVVWYAMSEMKKSFLARIADKMNELAAEDKE